MLKLRLLTYFICFIYTDSLIVSLTRRKDVYKGESLYYFCQFQSQTDSITLVRPDGRTAVTFKDSKDWSPNYSGYFVDLNTTDTLIVFGIMTPDLEGLYECVDNGDSTRKSDNLTLLAHDTFCSTNNPSSTTENVTSETPQCSRMSKVVYSVDAVISSLFLCFCFVY